MLIFHIKPLNLSLKRTVSIHRGQVVYQMRLYLTQVGWGGWDGWEWARFGTTFDTGLAQPGLQGRGGGYGMRHSNSL